ncbi:MAG: phosphatidate cytidylyltransferase [Tepidanaerobacteraceae bacterium]|jgi:phosphatidate cytidylyltransferase|nr:phosphatidate cytidylyltransferase [Thermoanaerobacterales bacterium]
MLTRIISAIVGIVALMYIINAGGWIFFLSICLLNIFAMYELYKAFQKKGVHITFFLNSISTAILLYYISFYNDFNFIWVSFLIFLLIMLECMYGIINNNRNHIINTVYTVFSFVYTTLLFMFFILVRNLPNGINFIWWIFITTWACDTGAFFTGIYFGKNPLAPHISPNKTIEGSLGGVVLSIIASIIFTRFFISEISILHAIILGILIGSISQIGDLSASLIKRYCKIKDFSNIIPGHGGILDRLDSALFSFPIAYIYIMTILEKGGLP